MFQNLWDFASLYRNVRMARLRGGSWVAHRHALQHPVAEGFVQSQSVEVDVADVTAAGVVAARALGQAALEVRGVQVADRLPDEVAAADRSIAVHRDDRGPRP